MIRLALGWLAEDLCVSTALLYRAIPGSLVALLVGFVACVLATVLYQ